MSPLDDELRAALSRRAQAVTPAPDPLAGIERRAKQIQRTRISAAVAGSALAVALVAAVVPAVQGATSSGPPPVQFATQPPSASPVAPRDARPAAAVDWGSPLDERLDRGYLDQWDALHRKPAGSSTGEVLFRGQTNDGVEVHVYQLWFDSERAYAVVGHSSEGGAQIARGTILEPETMVIDAVVPGGELPSLVVVYEPGITTVQYAPDGTSFTTIEDDDPTGVITERTGPKGDVPDRIRLLDASGQVRYDEPVFVSDETDGSPSDGEGESDPRFAAYGLDLDDPWDFRGVGDPADLAVEDERLFVQTRTPRAEQEWSARPLYAASSDAGVEYLFVLHTAPGQDAVVTTTYRVDGGPARQLEQVVRDGQMLIQATLPTALPDGAVMHVALASPRAGGIVLEQGGRSHPDGIGDPGVGLWAMDAADQGTGRILLYTEGDGVEYHVEDVTTL